MSPGDGAEDVRPLLPLDSGEGVPNVMTIYTDSQSLNSCWITSKTMWECESALTDLSEFVFVHLRWVKGHSGVHGNEMSDRLGKEASC